MLVALALALLAAPQPLTLAEALSRAERANADLAAARLGEPVARAGIESAGQLANPTLSLSVGPDEPTFSAGLDLKLPIFGQRGAAVTAAERQLPVAQAELAAQGVRVRASVRRAYFALSAAQAQVELALEAAKLAEQLEVAAREKFAAGSAPQLDAEQAALARRRAEQERVDRAAAAVGAEQDLARLLGEPQPTQATQSTQDGLLATDPLLPSGEVPPLDELLSRVQRHPEVRSLSAQQQAALARADSERTAVRPLPTISIQLLKLMNEPYIGVRGGLAFDLPLLSLNRGRVHQETATAAQNEAQARAALVRLSSEVKNARTRAANALQRARFYANDLVPAAQRVEGMARAGYQLGRAALISVLQAQGEVAGARGKSIDAAAEAQKALADLEEAAGGN